METWVIAPVEAGMEATIEVATRSEPWTIHRVMEATADAESPGDLGLSRTGEQHQARHRNSTKYELLHLYPLSESIEELSQGAPGWLESVTPIRDG